MIDTTTVLITTAASYRTVCTRAQEGEPWGSGKSWKSSIDPSPSPSLTGLTLLATHFARLRSRYRLIDDYNNDRLLYIQRAPPVQSASKQIGSRFERSHAIIPISLPYVYQIYIYTHLEFFIFPLYMNSNQPSPNQVALIPASLQLVAITQIPRLSIHNLFVSINVREYVEVIPRPRLIIDCRETQFDIIPYCQNKIRGIKEIIIDRD